MKERTKTPQQICKHYFLGYCHFYIGMCNDNPKCHIKRNDYEYKKI